MVDRSDQVKAGDQASGCVVGEGEHCAGAAHGQGCPEH